MTTILEQTAGLAAFVRTVDTGSFSKAARAIGSTPSAVSKSVARLEHRLGVRLLQRSTRTLGLTSEGAAYYERVAPLLRAIEDAEDLVQQAGHAGGLLRVSASLEFGRTLVAPWIGDFTERHPAVKVELSLTDRNIDLAREGFDLAIRLRDLADTQLIGRKLAELRAVMCAAPAYIARRGLPATVTELPAHACVRYLMSGRPYPFSFADGRSLIPDGPFDSDDGGAVREAVLAGAGIGYLPYYAVAAALADGRLVRVLPALDHPTMPVHVLHAYGRQLPVRARVFIDFLAEKMARVDI